jgi:C-terminal processing protease CtpA/Prc
MTCASQLRGLAVFAIAALGGLHACTHTEVVQSFPDNYVGVGLELTIQDDTPVVVRTLEGGSAEQVGVEPGDRLLEIDGKSTKDITLGNAVMMIRGEPGSQVRLTIDRKDHQLVVIVPRQAMTKGAAADYRAAK